MFQPEKVNNANFGLTLAAEERVELTKGETTLACLNHPCHSLFIIGYWLFV